MVVEGKHRLATTIFCNVVVSLLNVKYRFSRLRLRYVIWYLQPRSATDGYPSFTGHLLLAPKIRNNLLHQMCF